MKFYFGTPGWVGRCGALVIKPNGSSDSPGRFTVGTVMMYSNINSATGNSLIS